MRLIIILIGISPFCCSAQEIILRIGSTFSSVELAEYKIDPNNTTSYKSGWMAGADVRFNFNRFLGLTTNLLFSQRGWKASNSGIYSTVEDARVNYLDLSLMPMLKIRPFYIMTGPAVCLGLSGRYHQSGAFGTHDYSVVFSSNKTGPHLYIDRKVDLAAVFVIGFNISKKFSADVRYQNSLNDFFIVETSRYKSWQVTLGYRVLKR